MTASYYYVDHIVSGEVSDYIYKNAESFFAEVVAEDRKAEKCPLSIFLKYMVRFCKEACSYDDER